MTTLAAGSSVSLTLANNGFLEVATNGGFGSVTITPTGGGAVTESWGPSPFRKKYSGPYPEGATVTLTNASSAAFDYEIDSGNLPLSLQGLAVADGNRYAIGLGLFGDSITNNGYFTDGTSPDGASPSAYFVPGTTSNNARAMGWSTWVGPMSMQRIQVVKSWARQTNGVLAAGTSPAGFPLSVQITQALADPAWSQVNRAVVLIGTNDTTSSIATWTAALLVQLARLAGKQIDLITPPPRNDGTATAVGGDSLAGWAWLMQVRAVLKRIADASGGRIKYIDGYSAVNTGAVPDALGANNVLPDNIHPSNVGAYLIANAYVNAVLPSSLGGDLDIWAGTGNAGSTNAAALDQGFSNPNFLTASGGTLSTGTGALPAGLTLTAIGTGAAGACSVAANTMTSGTGNMATIPITSSAAGDGVDLTTSSVHAAGGTFLTTGDVAWAQMMVRINSGGIYPRNLFFRLTFFNGTNYFSLLYEVPGTAGDEKALPLTASRTFLLRTPSFTVPAGIAAASSITAKFRPTFAAAGSCTIDVSNLEIRRIRSGTVYA